MHPWGRVHPFLDHREPFPEVLPPPFPKTYSPGTWRAVVLGNGLFYTLSSWAKLFPPNSPASSPGQVTGRGHQMNSELAPGQFKLSVPKPHGLSPRALSKAEDMSCHSQSLGFRTTGQAELEGAHQDHPVQLLALHRHPNNPTLCLGALFKAPWALAALGP